MWKFVTKKRAPDDIVFRLPDPVKATSKEAADKMKAANTEIVNALAKTKQPWSPNVGLKEKLPITLKQTFILSLRHIYTGNCNQNISINMYTLHRFLGVSNLEHAPVDLTCVRKGR